MGIIKSTAEGFWSISSKMDPRFNAQGQGVGSGSRFTKPKEAELKLVELIAQHGEPPPDLT